MEQDTQKKQEKKRSHLVFTDVEGEFLQCLTEIPHVEGVSQYFLTTHVSPRTLPSPGTVAALVWELHMCKDVKAGYVFHELWDRVAEVADKFGYVCAFTPLEGSSLSEEGHPVFRFMVFRLDPMPPLETPEPTTPASMGKTMTVRDGADLVEKVSDVEVVGNPDAWRLVCKASSQKEGWMKSTKVMQVGDPQYPGGGCLVQVTTQQGSHVAESVCYVPGAKIEDFFIDE